MTTRAQYRQAARAVERTPAVEHSGPNRAEKRAHAWAKLPRPMRRNLWGRGRWRRTDPYRYAEPFAQRLDG